MSKSYRVDAISGFYECHSTMKFLIRPIGKGQQLIVICITMASVITVFVLLYCIANVELLHLGSKVSGEENKIPIKGCSIDVNKDFTYQHPLILKADEDEYVLPNIKNGIQLENSQTLRLACPGQGNHFSVNKNVKEMEVACVSNKTFKATSGASGSWQFKALKCADYPEPAARHTGKKCLSKFSEIEIGFKISSGFVRTMVVCFDDAKRDSLYSMYNLTGRIGDQQYSVPRPSDFEEGGFYPGLSPHPSTLYTRKSQRTGFTRTLGSAELAAKYISLNDDFFLSRGHLTAKADFVYGSQQRSTFYYVNVAPQWQTFNGNNWNELEISTRNFAAKRHLDLVVYTGVWGRATLPDIHNIHQPLSLFFSNGKQAITVPAIYWKILHDPVTKTGVAFIGHNNPYDEGANKHKVCTDVCDQINWVSNWNSNNITAGYSYCCDVTELRKIVDLIPEFTVHGLLM